MSLTKIIAELCLSTDGKPVRGYLVGEDNLLYAYNNAQHQVRPFDQHGQKPRQYDLETAKQMQFNGILEYCPEYAEIYGPIKREFTTPPHW